MTGSGEMAIVVGNEYQYLGQPVRVRTIDIPGDPDAEAAIETRFGEYSHCRVDELGEWP